MKTRILPIILLISSLALAIVSFILLPETVTTQFSLNGSAATSMPKIWAVLLPTLLGIGGAVTQLITKSETHKPMIVSGVGILVFVIMLIANLSGLI